MSYEYLIVYTDQTKQIITAPPELRYRVQVDALAHRMKQADPTIKHIEVRQTA